MVSSHVAVTARLLCLSRIHGDMLLLCEREPRWLHFKSVMRNQDDKNMTKQGNCQFIFKLWASI